ncbi:MAG: hypothetical protein KatS3mg111_2274 [Pirellulaceae bacterium]|nr:MAG: hypothetical protein KatS3mg111_2274 [Pirellulaceae bacterium]
MGSRPPPNSSPIKNAESATQQLIERPPYGQRFLFKGRWHPVLVVSWPVAPAVLVPHLPAGTELDLYRGRAYLSVVFLIFSRFRVAGLPFPLRPRFATISLRFYVRRWHPTADHGIELRPGVSTIGQVVPSRLLLAVARWSRGEKGTYRPIGCRTGRGHSGERELRFEWVHDNRPQWVRASMAEAGYRPQPTTLESFVLDRSWHYTRHENGCSTEHLVCHRPWHVCPLTAVEHQADVAALFAPQWSLPLDLNQAHFMMIDGSDVAITYPQRLAATATALPQQPPVPVVPTSA